MCPPLIHLLTEVRPRITGWHLRWLEASHFSPHLLHPAPSWSYTLPRAECRGLYNIGSHGNLRPASFRWLFATESLRLEVPVGTRGTPSRACWPVGLWPLGQGQLRELPGLKAICAPPRPSSFLSRALSFTPCSTPGGFLFLSLVEPQQGPESMEPPLTVWL